MVDRPKKPSAIPPSPFFPTPKVAFSDDNSRITATLPTGESIEVLLYGATVISWKVDGRENLFLSDKAHLDGSKAVRGGIPLVFPVFGPPPSSAPISSLPQHGFARTSRWEYLNKSTSESATAPNSFSDSSVKIDLGLSPANLTAEAKKAWPYKFALIYSITLGRDGLETSVSVRNEGEASFEFQFLLHTYLKVKDIAHTTVAGLSGASYIDRVKGASEHQETHSALPISSETDRVYKSLNPEKPISVLEGGNQRYEITRDGLDDVVVWNPWAEKAAAMSDLGPKDAWKGMICIEAGTVSGWQKLEAGDIFEGGQIIKSQL